MIDAFEIELDWKPKAKERPRFAKGHVYTPKATLDAEKALADAWREADGPYWEAGVMLEVGYIFTKDGVRVIVDGHEDYANRSLRGDVDNYMKTANDALNGVAWADDKQIVSLYGRKL